MSELEPAYRIFCASPHVKQDGNGAWRKLCLDSVISAVGAATVQQCVVDVLFSQVYNFMRFEGAEHGFEKADVLKPVLERPV